MTCGLGERPFLAAGALACQLERGLTRLALADGRFEVARGFVDSSLRCRSAAHKLGLAVIGVLVELDVRVGQARNFQLRTLQFDHDSARLHCRADIGVKLGHAAGHAGADIDPAGGDLALKDKRRWARGKPQQSAKSRQLIIPGFVAQPTVSFNQIPLTLKRELREVNLLVCDRGHVRSVVGKTKANAWSADKRAIIVIGATNALPATSLQVSDQRSEHSSRPGGGEWESNPPETGSLPRPDLKSGRPTGDDSLP